MTTNVTKTENNVARYDRHHYGVWRAKWRQDYATLSADIRKAKIDCKEDQRANDGHSMKQESLVRLRKRATEMMADRTTIDEARGKLAKMMGLKAPVVDQVVKAA